MPHSHLTVLKQLLRGAAVVGGFVAKLLGNDHHVSPDLIMLHRTSEDFVQRILGTTTSTLLARFVLVIPAGSASGGKEIRLVNRRKLVMC